MKIVVKYWTTEIEVSDNNDQDGRGLIYHNQQYTIQLLEKIVYEIHKLNKGGEQ